MESTTLTGKVKKVFYANRETCWMTGIMKPEGAAEIKFCGQVIADVGDALELTGEWKTHPKFGRQFEAVTGVVKMDDSPDALAHLLASDKRFEGIGPGRAKAVVSAALALSNDGAMASALVEYPAEIAERTGCPLKSVELAGKLWGERRGYFDALAQLVDQGWSGSQAHAIVTHYGEMGPSIVKDEPYQLIGKIARFGFRTVDAVALKMGLSRGSAGRLAAGIAYCLDRSSNEGNVWTTREDLLHEAGQELRPNTMEGTDMIVDALEGMIELGAIYSDEAPDGSEILADDRLARAELEVFDILREGLTSFDTAPLDTSDPTIQARIEQLNKGQRAAVEGFSARQFSVISGAAGSGKTFLVRAICEIAEANGISIALCAPTGKAAKRLEQSTDRTAKTIHRLLEPQFDQSTGGFSFDRGASNRLSERLIIVDEVSMVDVRLMRSLLVALSDGARLLLVGDHNQIPSVGPGAILRDLLAARDQFPDAVHTLTDIVRQAGVLARNTYALIDGVVDGRDCESWGIQRTERGHEDESAEICAALVEALATATSPKPFNRQLDLAWDIQVLAPQRKGPLGVHNLNVQLQRVRQRLLGNPAPEPVEKDRAPKPLRGDRVIWTKNDYELELFNGTLATVQEIRKGGDMVIRTEENKEVTISSGKRKHVEVAYALTIHKCLAAGTLVETNHGWETIESVVEHGKNGGKVLTTSGLMPYTDVIENPVDDLLRITVEGGYSIDVTPDHKLKVWSEGSCGSGGHRGEDAAFHDTQAACIMQGDFLRMKLGGDEHRGTNEVVAMPPTPDGDVRCQEIKTPAFMTPLLAEFFGLVVADGTVHRSGVRLLKRHADVSERFAELGKHLFGIEPKTKTIGNARAVEFNSTRLAKWLLEVGGMAPRKKGVPACVMASRRIGRARFLCGLFEDGTVNIKGNNVDHVAWSTCHVEMAKTVQTMLLEFGITCSMADRGRDGYDLWVLYLYGDSVKRFREEIGFVAAFKNDRLSDYQISRTRRHRVPIRRADFDCSTYTGQNARAVGYISRATAEDLGMSAELEYHYPRVISITKLRGKSYCLTVPETGSFLQNRFDGSNSQGSQWPCVVLVISSAHHYMRDRNLFYTGASRAAESLTILGDMAGIRSFAGHQRSSKRQTFGGFLPSGWTPTATV